MATTEEIETEAKKLFAAHAAFMGRNRPPGTLLPTWESLPEARVEYWTEIARASLEEASP